MTQINRNPFFVSVVVLSAAAFPHQTKALEARAWVSGHGLDKPGCGAVADPCRTLQFAHDKIVDYGGEIDILDPAGYGPLSIKKSLTVANDGVGVSDLQAASGASVTIDATSGDVINLRGLSLDGGGVVAFGVRFNSGGLLTIRDSVIRGFATAGVYVSPSGPASFTLADVTLSKNGQGVFVKPQSGGAVRGLVNRTSIDNSTTFGVFIQGGAATTETVTVTLFDSSTSQNGFGVGVASSGAKTSLFARDVIASNNRTAGFLVNGANTVLRLAHSVATGSNVGVTMGSGGVCESFGDNNLQGNNVAVSGGALTKVANQ